MNRKSLKSTEQKQWLEKFRGHLSSYIADVSLRAAKEKCPTQGEPKEIPVPELQIWNWGPLVMFGPSQATRQPSGMGMEEGVGAHPGGLWWEQSM